MKTAKHILKTGWKGENGMEDVAETLDTICRMINGMDVVEGGTLFVDKDKIHIRARGIPGSASFTGIVYLSGNRFYDASKTTDTTGTQITDNSTDGAKTLIKVDVGNNTVTYEDGPMPIPFPAGVEYYERVKTAGDIHITRF